MVKVNYEFPNKDKNKLDAEAFENGTRVVDYHKNSNYQKKLKVLFSVGLLVYFFIGIVIGNIIAEQYFDAHNSAACIQNAKDKLGLTDANSLKNLIDVCGWSLKRHGITEVLLG